MEGFVKSIGGIQQNIKISKAYVKKFPDVRDFLFSPRKLGEAVVRKVAGVKYYMLKPTKIYFLNNELGFGHRDELILP